MFYFQVVVKIKQINKYNSEKFSTKYEYVYNI